LLTQQHIPGTLLILQVWKADEYFYFRAKPLPGSSIITTIGQMRTGVQSGESDMYFANER